MEDKVPDGGERACARANAAAVFVECHIADIVQAVLDGPVAARERKQALGTGLGRGQAGDDVSGLRADLSADLAGAFDAGNLGGAGPF